MSVLTDLTDQRATVRFGHRVIWFDPHLGIDAFLNSIDGQYRMVHNDYQVAIAKL